jgi:hypothetical protein
MVTESTAVAVRESAPPVIVPRNLQEMIDIAERLAKSSLLPEALRGKVPEVLMQIMAGQELGLYSMASLRSFNIISGKPVMGSDAMVAVVLGSGKAEYFRRVGDGTNLSVTYATKRRGEAERTCTWTMEMAKTAALHQKDNWRTYPRAMLASRAKSELARDVYPDVLAGCYTTDEIADRAPSAPPVATEPEVIDAEFTEQPAAPPSLNEYPEVLEMDTAPSIAALKALSATFAKRGINGPVRDAAMAKYKARLDYLKAQTAAPTAVSATAAPTAVVAPPAPAAETTTEATTAPPAEQPS